MRAPATSTNHPPSLPAAQVRAFRLGRHHLLHRAPPGSLVRVVSDLCGIQAQVPSAANLSARARVEQLFPEDVDRALWAERSLVRTWCLRSTVHLVPSKDLPLLAGALAARSRRDRERWAAARGIASREMGAVVREVVEAIEGAPVTYAELKRGIVAALPRRVSRACDQTAIAQFVQTTCLEGTLVSGPAAGARTTFVRSKRWIPGWTPLPARQAEDGLLRRYLRGYGPATLQDFSSWAGLANGDARPIWERLARAGEAVEVTVGGEPARLLGEDLAAIRAASPAGRHIRLLPAFDVYLLAHRDKALLVSAADYGRIYRKAARVSPVLLVGGRAAGIWSCRPGKGALRLRVEPFEEIPRAVRAGIDAEAADVARFLGRRVELEFGRIASPSFVI